MKRTLRVHVWLLGVLFFFVAISGAIGMPESGWLAQPNFYWEAISGGQHTSASGPVYSHLYNGTTPNPDVNSIQIQVFDGGVGPSSLHQTTTLQLTNFDQQTYTPGSATLGDQFFVPTSATLSLQAWYGANDVGVEFIGGTGGQQTSFNLTYQQELNWSVPTYSIYSGTNTLRSYTWLQDFDGGDGRYEARFGYSNTDGSSPDLHFQRVDSQGGIINPGTETYVMQDGTIVRNPTIGIEDHRDTISSDNPGAGGGPGRAQNYSLTLGSLVVDGSTFNVVFDTSAFLEIWRNSGNADGRFHANPSFSVQASFTVNYDAYQVAIPEPATGLLGGLGALALFIAKKRKRS